MANDDPTVSPATENSWNRLFEQARAQVCDRLHRLHQVVTRLGSVLERC